MIFLDTSAIYALADERDENHEKAKGLFDLALSQGEQFSLHSYILIEASALLQRRLGLEQTKKFLKESARFQIVWIDSSLHKLAEDYFFKHATRKLSLVDCASFVVMRQQGIMKALAFDDDFPKAGSRLYGK
ncbi:MAG TPA: PIN domain-containing protein [Candidatus Paceibacterota bacterium]